MGSKRQLLTRNQKEWLRWLHRIDQKWPGESYKPERRDKVEKQLREITRGIRRGRARLDALKAFQEKDGPTAERQDAARTE